MIETAFAYAKINISLDILSEMSDGYHALSTVMQTVGLCDEVTIECAPGKGVDVESNVAYLPRDERNIAAKAALAFFRHTGISGYQASVRIVKTIPVCAGLGGGSTDGACVLGLLDKMFGTDLGLETLKKIAGTIGSDVPFCVAGGTALAEGRGDILTSLPPIPRCRVVICKPPFALSTPELFRRVKCEKIHARPDTAGIITALGSGSLTDVARRMYNVFEDFLPRGSREIDDVKYALLDGGALGAVMTGSGPAVFGLFDEDAAAEAVYSRLRNEYTECYLTETREKTY